MELFLSVCLGIGLSAACGFRIFVPLLAISIAHHAGHLELGAGFAWMGTWPALITFAVATVLEVGAFYIPFVDNLLDSIAIPTATVAGIVASASCISDVSPMLQWTLAAITGGGVAAATQLATTKLRLVSSATTGGLGNPVVATAEAGGSILLSALSLLLPVLAALGALALIVTMLYVAAVLGKKLAGLAVRLTGKGSAKAPASGEPSVGANPPR